MAARAVRQRHPKVRKHKHLVPDVDGSHEGPTKISLDYMYLNDRRKGEQDVHNNPPQLVMVDHRFGRIWAHRVPNKGIWGKAEWVPWRIIQDLDNSGIQSIKLQVKTDQEPAMINIQTAMQELRPDKIIPTNSPVGESECNGRVENAIRRVQEKIRAIRHQVEDNIKCKILEDALLMSWLVGWSAELLSKYAVGEDGRTPYERIRKEDCVVPLVPFGETVMYLPLKTVHKNKGMPSKRVGVWIGVSERTEEILIGTRNGVVKCRIVERLGAKERWNKDAVLGMVGTPWEPVPGKNDQHIPVDIAEDGENMGSESENEEIQPERIDDELAEQGYKSNVDKFHVSRKAIMRFGETKGCPACSAIKTRGDVPGRIGKHHSEECRRRILHEMESDPQYRHLVKRNRGSNNDDYSKAESSISNVQPDIQKPHNDKHERYTDGDVQPMQDREEIMHMWSNVKKAIVHIKDRIKEIENERDRAMNGCLGAKLNETMLGVVLNQMQVSEVYSPPRVVEMANKMGLRGGWSLDLTTHDEDGRPWDFNDATMRNRAIRKIIKDQPLVLIGSPMCIEYSAINRINHSRMTKEEVEGRMAYARKHLEFCIKLYEIQWRNGRYFLHEHPAEAGSWQEPLMKKLMSRHGVQRVVGDQCQYGLKSRDAMGEAPARKRTGFLTNAVCIARRLSKRCGNKPGYQVHRHVVLTDGRPKAAQVYPDKFCKEICLGIQEQMQKDKMGQYLLANVQMEPNTTSKELMKEAKRIKERYQIVEEEDENEYFEAWDDVSGAALNPQEVKRARREEIDYVHKMNLYTKVPIKEAYQATGKAPISVRWIDINKGDTEAPNYRSRLVAREINTSKRDDLFAATPPLEALKVILSLTTSSNKGEIIMINDISRAFFHAPAKRQVYVQLPTEDKGNGDEEMCGKLNYSMYGTRDAAQNWFDAYSQHLKDIGFTQGLASPCTFYNQQRGIRTYVHGDDYVSIGTSDQLKWLQTQLEKSYQVKTQILGPKEGQLQQVKILNRVVTWDDKRGIGYEADPRHIEIIKQQLKLEEAKAVTTPGTKEEGRTAADHEEPLGDEQTTQYRAVTARCNYLSLDRPDVSFAVKELARNMASPTKGDWSRLKRLGRYLIGTPRLQQWFNWQTAQRKITTYIDADWAGCKNTRKSTTGGVVTIGNHVVESWSKTQALIALSSGESELYAALKAAAETLGVIAMLADFGLTMAGEIWGDAQATLGIINRNGLVVRC